MTENTDTPQPSAARQMLGDFSPGLVHFTDNVLFGQVWKRPQLSPGDRSPVTVAALIAGGRGASSSITRRSNSQDLWIGVSRDLLITS